MDDRRFARDSAPRWGWILLAVLAGIVVLVLTGVQQGFCADAADPALTRCETGPLLGVAGVWIAWGAYLVLLAACIRRVARRR